MSGLLGTRARVRKPVMVIAASTAAGAMAMGALWWASSAPAHFDGHSLQPACVALALDRASNTTVTAPCPGTPMLFAGARRTSADVTEAGPAR